MTDSVPKIIVIPAKTETPQEQEKKRNLRVAAYCRVSTDSEEQLTSYQNQLSYYTEKIMKEPNWTMAGVFADEGITGTSANKRKEFLRMIRQCRQGKIDMILVGPDCKTGIESTIVDLSGEYPVVVRPGTVTRDQLQEVIPKRVLEVPREDSL